MRITQLPAASLLSLAALMSLACDDSTGPTTGAILIRVSTTGASLDLDPDGYVVSVDAHQVGTVGINGTVTISDLSIGSHAVGLDGLSPNCSVSGPGSVSVDVKGSNNAPSLVLFSVTCVPKTGSIKVSVATSGADQDPDGYTVIVNGVSKGTLPPNGTLIISGLREGTVGVQLDGVSLNCIVDAPQSRTAAIAFGTTVEIPFNVSCVQGGNLQVTTATTGVEPDPNGYFVQGNLEGTTLYTGVNVGANATAAFPKLMPGNYRLTIFDMVPNCDAVAPSPRVVTVIAGSTTNVTLDVTCETPRQLAYVNRVGNNEDIYLVNSNGTAPIRLTTQAGLNEDPAWSPDGKSIAFTTNRDGNPEIYVIGAGGDNQKRITESGGVDKRPAWSPNGAKIAFVSERDGNPEIYVMNADGTSPARLTSNTGNDGDPAWSPDGSKIAFASERDGSRGIFVMNADGSAVTRLTSNSREDNQPAWSPDGTRIAFARGLTSSNAIFLVSSDGSGLTRLADYASAADPSWSPDGRKIAFSALACDYYYYYYCDPQIVVLRTDGIPYSSVPTPGPATNPAWRP